MSDKIFEPMICPVCGEFYFSDLQEGDTVEELFCHHCGWKYDLEQAKNHTLKDKTNHASVDECKVAYQQRISDNPDYDYLEDNYTPTPHSCPVCHKYTFEDVSSFDACPFCGWEDDAIMDSEPDKWAGTANDLCLNDYIIRYKKLVSMKPDYKYKKDKYL